MKKKLKIYIIAFIVGFLTFSISIRIASAFDISIPEIISVSEIDSTFQIISTPDTDSSSQIISTSDTNSANDIDSTNNINSTHNIISVPEIISASDIGSALDALSAHDTLSTPDTLSTLDALSTLDTLSAPDTIDDFEFLDSSYKPSTSETVSETVTVLATETLSATPTFLTPETFSISKVGSTATIISPPDAIEVPPETVKVECPDYVVGGIVSLELGETKEEKPTFQCETQTITYKVFVPEGSILSVSVKDFDPGGDIWEAKIFEEKILLDTTKGDGSLEEYSSPASATIETGRAIVWISYIKGDITNEPTRSESETSFSYIWDIISADIPSFAGIPTTYAYYPPADWPKNMYVKFTCSESRTDKDRMKQVVEDVISEILQGETEGKEIFIHPEPLSPGTEVKSWIGVEHIASTKEWMVLIDDFPMANWAHSARYVFVDYETGEQIVQTTILPPLNFNEMQHVIGGSAENTFTALKRTRTNDVVNETIFLDTGEQEELLEFQSSIQTITYEVVVPAGATLSVSVKDFGLEGDFWQAEIFERDILLGTTQGDGSIEQYSQPASATIATGMAQVRISYLWGVDVWPAHVYVKFASQKAETTECPGDVVGGTIALEPNKAQETYLEFLCGTQTITNKVVVPAGATLSVSVKDFGLEGDFWQAEIFEGGKLLGTTLGDGSIEQYSQPASATIATGMAQVKTSYLWGVEVWPAHTYVKFASTGAPAPTPGKKYALLISGGGNNGVNFDRYWNDISFMYRTLLKTYGYSQENIFVLFSDGKDPAKDQIILPEFKSVNSSVDLDADGDDDIDYAATLANINNVFSVLSNTLGENDQLFVFVTNHGMPTIEGVTDPSDLPHDWRPYYSTNVSLVLYYNKWIRDTEFASLVDSINAGSMIFVFGQCHSGGFIDNLSAPGRVVITAANWDEPSWAADTEGPYDEFVYHWTSAVNGATADGTSVKADMDGNGVVSIKEAFDYAKSNDSRKENPNKETPQYDEGSSGLGDQLSL